MPRAADAIVEYAFWIRLDVVDVGGNPDARLGADGNCLHHYPEMR